MRFRQCAPFALAAWVGASCAAGPATASVAGIRACVKANAPQRSAVHTLTVRNEDAEGLIDERVVRIVWQRGADGVSRTMLRVLEPQELAGAAMLIVEPASGLREAHMYLPALGKTRRVRSAAQLDGLLGGGFALEDIERLARLAERPGLLLVSEDETVADRPVWLVEARSGDDPAHAERLVGYIDKAHCVPVRIDVYSDGDRPTVRLHADPSETVTSAHTTVPRVIVAEDLERGSRATLTVEGLEVDAGVAEQRLRVEALAAPGR